MAEGMPVHAVITAVAEVTDSDPTELPLLNEPIDPEALTAFFDSSSLSQLRT